MEDTDNTLSSEIVLGCCIDLLSRSQWFTLNGEPIPIRAYFGNDDDVVVVPAVSFSGGIEKYDNLLCYNFISFSSSVHSYVLERTLES